MEFIPIKTRVLKPPKDDLFEVLSESLSDLKNKDVILVSSKVVAIHQGSTVPISSIKKDELIKQEADFIIPRAYFSTPLTVTRHAFFRYCRNR